MVWVRDKFSVIKAKRGIGEDEESLMQYASSKKCPICRGTLLYTPSQTGQRIHPYSQKTTIPEKQSTFPIDFLYTCNHTYTSPSLFSLLSRGDRESSGPSHTLSVSISFQ